MSRRGSRRGTPIWVLPILLVLILFAIFPIYWMVSTSLKPVNQVFELPLRWAPSPPVADAYVEVAESLNFPRYFANTLVVSLASTALSMAFALTAGYGFSRFTFRGKSLSLGAIIGTQMLPLVLLLIPYLTILRRLGLVNTYLALILAYLSFSLPYCTWVLIGFFATIPKEMDEAAEIDGCTKLQTLIRVVLPTALPGIGATAIFAFLNSWNQYLLPLVITTDWRMYTLPLSIASLMGQTRFQWTNVMAASTITTIPPMILFILFQRYFIRGLTTGSVK